MRELETFADVVALVEACPGLYLRYSEGPERDLKDGPSRDYESGQDLPGWSVTTVDPEPWWRRPTSDWVARRICKYAELGTESDRFPWLLRGRRVGSGPDHEPIVDEIAPVAVIGKAALDEAQERYRDRFDVGNDSRDET
ncbi:DUF6098 family protein [Mumia qirimensis]|uniref:DUF6098 family protein n=1 Tax=Mumia qirimensis TaxID=3234852 RepID=UPI00351CBC78